MVKNRWSFSDVPTDSTFSVSLFFKRSVQFEIKTSQNLSKNLKMRLGGLSLFKGYNFGL